MTAEIINLRQVRKQRARDVKAKQATENRIRFGRTRVEREQEALTQARAEEILDGHEREPTIATPPRESHVGGDGPLEPMPGSPPNPRPNPPPKPPQ